MHLHVSLELPVPKTLRVEVKVLVVDEFNLSAVPVAEEAHVNVL